MAPVRCAVYTRKSSDEGLEQAFNSLDAQRAACAAYIASQQSEGWIALPTAYDDGGVSGATLARPALQRLLADIEARPVDVLIVYKVDRLTRALSDFARLIEIFDRHAVSFISVTQPFNTTTSMGRLTLHVLLSFAQFERELTGERIRDKIAASKQKGLWMGGQPPLGYDVHGNDYSRNGRWYLRCLCDFSGQRVWDGRCDRWHPPLRGVFGAACNCSLDQETRSEDCDSVLALWLCSDWNTACSTDIFYSG